MWLLNQQQGGIMWKLRSAVVAVAMVGGTLGATQPAQAQDSQLYVGTRFTPGRICVETHDWQRWPIAKAVHRWGAAPNVSLVAWRDCSSQRRDHTIAVRTYSDPTDMTCVWADATSWTVVQTQAGEYLAPKDMTVWLNVAPRWYRHCQGSMARRAHNISWGIGRALGLATPDDQRSVMTSAVPWPTRYDRALVGALYR